MWPFTNTQSSQSTKPEISKELKQYSDEVLAGLHHAKNAEANYVLEEQPEPSRALAEAAKHNCAEFATAYAKCLSFGSFGDRSKGCSLPLGMLEKCIEMQTFALATLGFDSAKTTEERRNLRFKADDLMISAAPKLIITPENEAKFRSLLGR